MSPVGGVSKGAVWVTACLLLHGTVYAQGTSTTVIRGSVRAADGTDVDGAHVTVTNESTGFTANAEVQYGRFLIGGLEVGGPYTVTLRCNGFLTQRRQGLLLTLGEPIEIAVLLQRAAIPVDSVQVIAEPLPRYEAGGGTGATVPRSLVHGLPSLDRDMYDFVRLVPQISTQTGFRWGFSAGGVGIRLNNYLINGVSERSLYANATAALAGGRSIPLVAVEEYQVLVAPWDVRYGDFSGAVVNTVTRSGTNRLEVEAFAYGRNHDLTRGDTLFERMQYGLLLGGPVVRDRMHFLVASEIRRSDAPAPGPYVGQPIGSGPEPVSQRDLGRLQEILRGYGLEAGSGERVENRSPLTNVFGRLDLAIPEWNSRAVAWANFGHGTDDRFSRVGPESFPLSTFRASPRDERLSASVQLHTTLPRAGGGQNAVLLSATSGVNDWVPAVRQPTVSVSVPAPTGGLVSVTTGTPGYAQETSMSARAVDIRDDLTLPLGTAHVLSVGASVEAFRIDRTSVPGSYGDWAFSDLDALAEGVAEHFTIRRDFGSGRVPIGGAQYGVYVGDRWRAARRLSVTFGVRADVLVVDGTAPYNRAVDSVFGRRTDQRPHRDVPLSPRVGFTWDRSGTGRDRLRGGLGLYAGRPPLAWLHGALANYGVGAGVLQCGNRPFDLGPAPAFVPDYRQAPTACASGTELTTSSRGSVDLLAPRLRLPRTLRASLAYDRRLPWNTILTGEVLVTRSLSDLLFVNLNLVGPRAVDRNGRILYGRIGTNGVATPDLRSLSFVEVIDLQNTSRNRSLQMSARVERRSRDGASSILASYTYSRVRDVQTPLRTGTSGTENWSAKAVSGRHDDPTVSVSLNDVPHRVVLAGTFRLPSRRWPTELSFYYVGESGSPFTYVAWGNGSRGDLNADGSNTNDPIYVPRSAFDTTEIRFSEDAPGGRAAQQEAFEGLVERTSCLRRQRGRIMERNSCREPWSHTTGAAVRQTIPAAGHVLELELQAYNLLNLLRRDWGRTRLASPKILEHVAHTPGSADEAQPVFRFDTERPQWRVSDAESSFSLQVALRYRF